MNGSAETVRLAYAWCCAPWALANAAVARAVADLSHAWVRGAGGCIIEIRPMVVLESGTEVVRLWCMETNADEICVYAQPASVMPKLGDHVWWSGDKIYFDHDGRRRNLNKVGYPFSAPRKETREHEPAP